MLETIISGLGLSERQRRILSVALEDGYDDWKAKARRLVEGEVKGERALELNDQAYEIIDTMAVLINQGVETFILENTDIPENVKSKVETGLIAVVKRVKDQQTNERIT